MRLINAIFRTKIDIELLYHHILPYVFILIFLEDYKKLSKWPLVTSAISLLALSFTYMDAFSSHLLTFNSLAFLDGINIAISVTTIGIMVAGRKMHTNKDCAQKWMSSRQRDYSQSHFLIFGT